MTNATETSVDFSSLHRALEDALVMRHAHKIPALAARGADLDGTVFTFHVPLSVTMTMNDFDTFQALIAEGANPAVSFHGTPLFFMAAAQNLGAFFDVLLKHPKVDITQALPDGTTAADVAYKNGHAALGARLSVAAGRMPRGLANPAAGLTHVAFNDAAPAKAETSPAVASIQKNVPVKLNV